MVPEGNKLNCNDMSTSSTVFARHPMKTSNYMRKHLSAFHRPQKKLIHIPLHTSAGSRRSNYNNLKSHCLLKTREENLKSLSMFGMQVEEAKTKLCTCTNFQSNFWKNKWRLQIHLFLTCNSLSHSWNI